MTEEEKKAAAAKAKLEADSARAKSVMLEAVSEAQAPMVKAVAELAEAIKASVVEPAKTKATNNMGNPAAEVSSGVKVGPDVVEGQGIRAVRVLKAAMTVLLKGGGRDPRGSIEHLKSIGYTQEANAVERAMSQGVFGDGGALVPQEYTAELVALLRNKPVVRQMGAVAIPMGATLEMPTQESSASASWVGENQVITDSQPSTGSLKLAEKKLAALVAFSNDLIRNAAISAEEFIRNDLLQVIALKEDSTALFSAGGEYSPRGITSQTLAANQVNATAVSQIAPTATELVAELGKCVERMLTGNIPMVKLGWVFSPRTWRYLWTLRDNGYYVFKDEMKDGTLCGYPFMVTNQVPQNQTWSVDGSTDVTSIFFGDWSQFIIGESMSMTVELFPNAAFTTAGQVVSGISTDRSVIRALLKEDFLLRYNRAFTVVKTRMGA